MGVTFEGTQYQSSNTSPDIPYTIYVGDTHLLLVPRDVAKVHPNFPPMPDPLPRIKLEVNEFCASAHKAKTGKDPKFSCRKVDFGLEDDEVVVAALLEGSGLIPYWEFRTLMAGDSSHFTDQSSSPEDSYGMMVWDLTQAAGPPPS